MIGPKKACFSPQLHRVFLWNLYETPLHDYLSIVHAIETRWSKWISPVRVQCFGRMTIESLPGASWTSKTYLGREQND